MICDQTVVLTGFYSRQDFDTPLRRIKFKDPETGKRLVFLTNNFALPAITIADPLSMPVAGRIVFQMDQAASSYQSLLRHLGERRQDTNLDRCLGLCARRRLTMFERMPLNQLLTKMNADRGIEVSANQLNLFD